MAPIDTAASIVDGERAGYAIYGFEGDAFHLMNLAITRRIGAPGWRRRSWTTFCPRRCAFGAPDVWLEVAVDNEPARRLYEAYGFEVVRVRRKYYQPGGIDALVMRRELHGYAPRCATS